MHSLRNDSISTLLYQDGLFAVDDNPPSPVLFSTGVRDRTARLRKEGLLTRYRVIRNQIFEFLNVRSFKDIRLLLDDEAKRRTVDRRAYLLLGNMFGIKGNDREIVARVNSYSRTADNVIRYLKGKVLANYAANIEMTNEIDVTSSPAELLLTIFNDRYHQKARFEAKRKLILMQLAGSIDHRERETDVEAKFSHFLNFLNEFVWSRDIRIGELESVYLLSSHDPPDFSCKEVRVFSRQEAEQIKAGQGQKLSLLKRRRFQAKGSDIPIYVSMRKKPPEAKVLKLLRKGEENPAVAVDDELGLMGVMDTVMQVKLFQKHLTQSAIRADSFMTLEEVSDTLSGRPHYSGNSGSSPKTSMFKFFARMGGMRVEFILHTNKSYCNYMYQRDVAHDEYEVKRIFDSGVADLLFPRGIYHLDMEQVRNKQIRWYRRLIEEQGAEAACRG